jgi:hypothetical protein
MVNRYYKVLVVAGQDGDIAWLTEHIRNENEAPDLERILPGSGWSGDRAAIERMTSRRPTPGSTRGRRGRSRSWRNVGGDL